MEFWNALGNELENIGFGAATIKKRHAQLASLDAVGLLHLTSYQLYTGMKINLKEFEP